MNLIKLEFKKIKSSKYLLPLFLIPLFACLFGAINYYGNRELLKNEWISLWTQVFLFYGMFFYPSIVGLVCAYVWNGEHRNNNISKLLSYPKSIHKIALSKMIASLIICLIPQFFMSIFYFLEGAYFKFQTGFPLELIKYLLYYTVFSLITISFQSYLSIKIKSFAIPVAISMILGFLLNFITAAAISETGSLIFYYLTPSQSIVTAMNRYPEILLPSKDILLMFISTIIFSSLFFLLQIKALKNLRDRL